MVRTDAESISSQTPLFRGSLVSRGPPGHHAFKGLSIVLAGALAFGVFVVAPRPDITLTAAQFQQSDCARATMTRTLTAVFTLRNAGSSDGDVSVHLNMDGSMVQGQDFSVPAQTSVQGQLSAVLNDCATHGYTVTICIPHGKYANC